jgi:hypothetical protein
MYKTKLIKFCLKTTDVPSHDSLLLQNVGCYKPIYMATLPKRISSGGSRDFQTQ